MYWILFLPPNNGCRFERETFYEAGKDTVDRLGDEILSCASDKSSSFSVRRLEINLGEV